MKDIMVKAKKKEGMFVAATEGGKSGVPAVRVFHEHAKIYDSWYENSLVFAIELAALQSLQTVMKGPGIEIGVGPGRFAREIGLEFGLDRDRGVGSIRRMKRRNDRRSGRRDDHPTEDARCL